MYYTPGESYSVVVSCLIQHGEPGNSRRALCAGSRLFAVGVQGLWDLDDTSEEDLLDNVVIEEISDDAHRQAKYLELVNNV